MQRLNLLKSHLLDGNLTSDTDSTQNESGRVIIKHFTNLSVVQLDRPLAMNAITLPMITEMMRALDYWNTNENIKVILFTTSHIFSAHILGDPLERKWHRILRRWRSRHLEKILRAKRVRSYEYSPLTLCAPNHKNQEHETDSSLYMGWICHGCRCWNFH